VSLMGKFREIPPPLLARLQANPALVERILDGDVDQSSRDSEDPAQWAASLEAQLKGLPPTDAAQAKGIIAQALNDLPTQPPEVQRALLQAVSGMLLEAIKKSQGKTSTPPRPPESKPDGRLDIEKAWHGLHFLLAGSAQETTPGAGQAVLGGREVGPDQGYGPARLLDPSEVVTVSKALSAVTPATLKKRFKPEALDQADIYPGGWAEEPGALQWLLDAFKDLQKFYASAASRGSAVLLTIR
jgi:hypothetical protein